MKHQTLNSIGSKPGPGTASGFKEVFGKNDYRSLGNKKKEEGNIENGAIYFLIFLIITIVSVSLFKSKILHFLFSHFL